MFYFILCLSFQYAGNLTIKQNVKAKYVIGSFQFKIPLKNANKKILTSKGRMDQKWPISYK